MTRRGVGLLVILTCAIALGALVQDYRFDTLLAGERDAAAALDADAGGIRVAVAGLQAAQRAYVGAGQAVDDWQGQVTELADRIDRTISRRRAAIADTATDALYGAAAAGMTEFRTLDAQARAAIARGEPLHAADLVFMDAASTLTRVADSVAAAQARERAAIDADITQLSRLRLAINAVAVLFVLAVLAYFARAVTALAARNAPTTADMIRDLPPPVKPANGPTTTPAPGSIQLPPATTTLSRPGSLSVAAELCVDLARVLDADAIPALLERTASVLDARGVVLWGIETDGARLRPSLSHGYSERVLRKLRPLQIDADNVTSLAYRTLEPQTMAGATSSDSGAIAIPLITGTGCVGVMAAELRHARPHADLLPVARIIAAQLSTLVAAPEVADRRTAQA